MAQYTNEEIEEFIQQEDIEFMSMEHTNSVKTNLYVSDKNSQSLFPYLSKLKALIVKTKNSINIDNIINAVAERYQNNKVILVLDNNVPNNNQIVFGINYNVLITDNNYVEISNNTNPNGVTDNLIIQIKDITGVIITNNVISGIITSENKIKILFNEVISIQYKVIFI